MNANDQELNDAIEMLGKGYDHPSLEIEPARTVIERRDGRMQEVERAAFVKISTAFKAEMKDIDEVALKVWLYIALSVNRHSNKANPGLRKIAEETGFAVNTVRDAVERLENKYGLLTIESGSGKSPNIYEPAAFVSAKKSVSSGNTQDSGVSVSSGSVSVSSGSVSASRQKNAQPENQSNQSVTNAQILKSANAQVDAILDNELKAQKSWQGREKLPEPLRDLADEFVNLTGLRPQKKELAWWMGEFSDWLGFGIQRKDISAGVQYAKDHNFGIMQPSSLTKTLRMLAANRQQLASRPTIENTPRPEIPAGWQRIYDNA